MALTGRHVFAGLITMSRARGLAVPLARLTLRTAAPQRSLSSVASSSDDLYKDSGMFGGVRPSSITSHTPRCRCLSVVPGTAWRS